MQHAVWRCPQCGLGRTTPPLAGPERLAAYPAAYEPYHARSSSTSDLRQRLGATVVVSMGYPQAGALPLPAFVTRSLAAVRGWSWQPPPPPSGRLLDVGCGSGAYGASLIRLGWEVYGIEPDAAAAERARRCGLCVVQAGVAACELPAASYDVVTLWHVLEHLDEPLAAQYVSYLGDLACGRLGLSLRTGRPVSAEILFRSFSVLHLFATIPETAHPGVAVQFLQQLGR